MLNDHERAPDYFIVPSKVVADYSKVTHKEWLSTPGRSGAVHSDTPVRNLKTRKRNT